MLVDVKRLNWRGKGFQAGEECRDVDPSARRGEMDKKTEKREKKKKKVAKGLSALCWFCRCGVAESPMRLGVKSRLGHRPRALAVAWTSCTYSSVFLLHPIHLVHCIRIHLSSANLGIVPGDSFCWERHIHALSPPIVKLARAVASLAGWTFSILPIHNCITRRRKRSC